MLTATQGLKLDTIDRKLVPKLTDKTFPAETKKSNVMMVVFYMSSMSVCACVCV